MPQTEKRFIKNRDGKKIAVVIEQPEGKPRGLAFFMHGQGGFKEQPHIRTYVESFLAKGFVAVSFDARDTLGESEGSMDQATIGGYMRDLEEVINWSADQPWYQKPFVLVGHSAGSMCMLLYAESHPQQVRALVPTSASVSGQLVIDAMPADLVAEWKRQGVREWESHSKPGVMKRIPWSAIEDMLQYDVLKEINALTMPVLLIVGSEDESTPVEQQKLLFEALPGPKEMHIIAGAQHTFREEQHLAEIRQIIEQWIDSWI